VSGLRRGVGSEAESEDMDNNHATMPSTNCRVVNYLPIPVRKYVIIITGAPSSSAEDRRGPTSFRMVGTSVSGPMIWSNIVGLLRKRECRQGMDCVGD